MFIAIFEQTLPRIEMYQHSRPQLRENWSQYDTDPDTALITLSGKKN